MTEAEYWQGVAEGRWKSYHNDPEFQQYMQTLPIPEWVKPYHRRNPAPMELHLITEHEKFRHLNPNSDPARAIPGC